MPKIDRYDYKTHPNRVREYRDRESLTLEAAAMEMGISPSMLGFIELGKRTPSLPIAFAIADFYKTNVYVLWRKELLWREQR